MESEFARVSMMARYRRSTRAFSRAFSLDDDRSSELLSLWMRSWKRSRRRCRILSSESYRLRSECLPPTGSREFDDAAACSKRPSRRRSISRLGHSNCAPPSPGASLGGERRSAQKGCAPLGDIIGAFSEDGGPSELAIGDSFSRSVDTCAWCGPRQPSLQAASNRSGPRFIHH